MKSHSGIDRSRKKGSTQIPQAKTIAEANELAVSLGLTSYADFNGLDIVAANEMIQGVARARELFPELPQMEFLGSIQNHNKYELEYAIRQEFEQVKNDPYYARFKLTDEQILNELRKNHILRRTPAGIWAWSSDHRDTRFSLRAIAFNERKFSSQKIKDMLDGDIWGSIPHAVKTKWHPEGCTTIKSIVDHEMGHQIDYLLKANSDSVIGSIFRQYRGQEKMTNALSKYANTNVKEFIAEAWAEYTNNPHPREVSRAVASRLFKLRKGLKK